MEYTPIKDIKRAEYNPRIMPDQEMRALKQSILTFGFVEPVVLNRREGMLVLVGGHQRLTAVTELVAQGKVIKGLGKADDPNAVPSIVLELTIDQEKALNLALNKIKGKWDEPKLAEMIQELKGSELIPATGFREDEISNILDQAMAPPEDEGDGDTDLTKEARSIPGEVYELGPHRLICGDATDPETYDKLLGKEKASMVWTDPPYNVAYKSKGEALNDQDKQSIKNDDLSPADFKVLIDGAFLQMFKHTEAGGAFYICSGWQSYPQFLDSMLKNGFYHSGVITWVKPYASLSYADYKHQTEIIAKAKKPDAKTAQTIVYGWNAGVHHFYGDNEVDVWEMPRKSVLKYLHPTEKPDWLPMRAIRNSSKRNDIVLDPFAGSGSVMAGADKTGRRAYMIELDPKFCDAIRDRWERLEKLRQGIV